MSISLGDKPSLQCPKCGRHNQPDLTWKHVKDDLWHLTASCPACSAYIKHVPQELVWLANAPTRPSVSENKPVKQSGLF